MAFLLDTVTVSEAGKSKADPSVLAWYKARSDAELFISVLTIGEIRRGIAARRRRDAAGAGRLDQWLAVQRAFFADRILMVDEAVAECWGRLSPAMTLPVIDGLLAATAIVHGLTVATRNTRDFLAAGVGLVNPWDSSA